MYLRYIGSIRMSVCTIDWIRSPHHRWRLSKSMHIFIHPSTSTTFSPDTYLEGVGWDEDWCNIGEIGLKNWVKLVLFGEQKQTRLEAERVRETTYIWQNSWLMDDKYRTSTGTQNLNSGNVIHIDQMSFWRRFCSTALVCTFACCFFVLFLWVQRTDIRKKVIERKKESLVSIFFWRKVFDSWKLIWFKKGKLKNLRARLSFSRWGGNPDSVTHNPRNSLGLNPLSILFVLSILILRLRLRCNMICWE